MSDDHKAIQWSDATIDFMKKTKILSKQLKT